MAATTNSTPSTAAAEQESLLILLIATTPGMKIDYKMMSALDSTRTAAAIEHRFRKYKARAQEIVAAKGGDLGAGVLPQGLVPATPTKKRVKKTTGDGDPGDGGDGEETPKKKARAPKTPKSPATPKTPKTPKSPKVVKAAKGKVKDEGNGSEGENGNHDQDALDSVANAEAPDPGNEFTQDMNFEFEGSQQEEEV